jgi:hypothetical protein
MVRRREDDREKERVGGEIRFKYTRKAGPKLLLFLGRRD